MPKSAEEVLKDELDIDITEEDKKWEDEYARDYEDILEFYTNDERQLLQNKYYGNKQYNLFGEEVAAPEDEDEFDEQKLKKFVNHVIQKDQQRVLSDYWEEQPKRKKKGRKKKNYGLYDYGMPVSPRIIKITKKAFYKLREIADEQDLFLSAECAGFLYGKKDTITKVKKYDCSASAGLVTGNPIDVFNQAKRKDYIGLFHSHLFNSSSMSGTDREVLAGWTSYSNMCNKTEPIMIIARSPRWKIKAWSMNSDFKSFENRLVFI
jgi:hypothetical protein